MESKQSKNIYMLSVKRGLKWSERKVEITKDCLQYFNGEELRFKTLILDINLTEKNSNNTKEYTIKIASKTK
jgi:hypothetical protein